MQKLIIISMFFWLHSAHAMHMQAKQILFKTDIVHQVIGGEPIKLCRENYPCVEGVSWYVAKIFTITSKSLVEIQIRPVAKENKVEGSRGCFNTSVKLTFKTPEDKASFIQFAREKGLRISDENYRKIVVMYDSDIDSVNMITSFLAVKEMANVTNLRVALWKALGIYDDELLKDSLIRKYDSIFSSNRRVQFTDAEADYFFDYYVKSMKISFTANKNMPTTVMDPRDIFFRLESYDAINDGHIWFIDYLKRLKTRESEFVLDRIHQPEYQLIRSALSFPVIEID